MDNIEDEIFEISDEKSDKIFELFNNIRLHSKDYINQSNDENISNLLEKSANYSLKPNALIKSQNLYFQFREGLMNNYATPRDDETLLEDIYNAFLIILNCKITFLLNVLLIMKKNLFGNYLKNMKMLLLKIKL